MGSVKPSEGCKTQQRLMFAIFLIATYAGKAYASTGFYQKQ
jgi:hypothetical protein